MNLLFFCEGGEYWAMFSDASEIGQPGPVSCPPFLSLEASESWRDYRIMSHHTVYHVAFPPSGSEMKTLWSRDVASAVVTCLPSVGQRSTRTSLNCVSVFCSSKFCALADGGKDVLCRNGKVSFSFRICDKVLNTDSSLIIIPVADRSGRAV
jgi:hypothetical protein